MENILVKTLTLNDYNSLIELWNKADLDFHEGFRDTKSEIEKQLKSGCVIIFAALKEDVLVGSVLCSDDARRGWINHIAVLPEQRNKGIAKKLIGRAEEYFEKKGLKIIAALVEDHNQSSWKLFERTGYKEEFLGLRYYTKRERQGV